MCLLKGNNLIKALSGCLIANTEKYGKRHADITRSGNCDFFFFHFYALNRNNYQVISSIVFLFAVCRVFMADALCFSVIH